MTKEEILKKYGDYNLQFISYYKYQFYFKKFAEEGVELIKIECFCGGTSEDIYRSDVKQNMTLRELDKQLIINSIEISDVNKLIKYENN